ncbi:jerky protein homolog-like [Anastrepha obliqua]|uniref:jerky protein homolog-like n=1 Tax=Anastrepha obliqua TaxID=95512 RepID=UPI00240A65EE|nr:jerky protein homolog-like [Anastrepha obliqua]
MSEGLSQKSVLILDNAPSHPVEDLKSDDGNIFCYFLPPNSTAVLQPMDQSLIHGLSYRRCWNKLWPNTESPSNNSDDASQADVVTSTSSALPLENSETINEWLNCDKNDCGYELLTDEKIVNEVNDEEENNDDCDGTDNNNENGHNPTVLFLRQEAKIAASNLEKFIAWYEMQDEAGLADTIRLRQFLLFAKNKTQATLKQNTLTELFSKTN